MIQSNLLKLMVAILMVTIGFSCNNSAQDDSSASDAPTSKSAAEILGNPDYQAIAYGGYRELTREQQPTIEDLKEDMKILHAMGIRLFRTYNVHLPHAANALEAITQLKQEDPTFEMYVMLGAWINCENAWTDNPNHYAGDTAGNKTEIDETVRLANQYPDIVKVIAVGNEAMVKWAAAYHVQADVILKWVNHLQELKTSGGLPADMWITSSDNYASWGGNGTEYHKESLNELIKAVDFVSLHTYPMHETHYFPEFWGNFPGEEDLSKADKINKAMVRAVDYAKNQVALVQAYMDTIGVEKPIHIGETGWASSSNGFYGDEGTKATDEYKEGLYHKMMREWTDEAGMSCFYFEAFNEIWKDAENQGGSENHFGLITLDGKAKFALWNMVEDGTFEGLTRGGNPITKTYNGQLDSLLNDILLPPFQGEE